MCEEKDSEHAPLVADDEWDHDGDDQQVLLQVASVKNRNDKTTRLLRKLCLEVIFVLAFSTVVVVVLYYVHNKPFVDYFHEPHHAVTNSFNKTGSPTKTFGKTAEWTTLISGFGMYMHIHVGHMCVFHTSSHDIYLTDLETHASYIHRTTEGMRFNIYVRSSQSIATPVGSGEQVSPQSCSFLFMIESLSLCLLIMLCPLQVVCLFLKSFMMDSDGFTLFTTASLISLCTWDMLCIRLRTTSQLRP